MPTARFMGRVRIPMYLAPTTLSEDVFNACTIFPRQFGDHVIGFKNSNVFGFGLRNTGMSAFKAFKLYTNNATSFENIVNGQTGTQLNGNVALASVNNRIHICGTPSNSPVSLTNRPRWFSVSWPFNYSPRYGNSTFEETPTLGHLGSLTAVGGLNSTATLFSSAKVKLRGFTLSYTTALQLYVTGPGNNMGYSYVDGNGDPQTSAPNVGTSRMFLSVPSRILFFPTPQSGFLRNGKSTQMYAPGYNFYLSRSGAGNTNWAHGLAYISGRNDPVNDFVTSIIPPEVAQFENPAWTTYFNSAGATGSGHEICGSDAGVIFIRLVAATPANYVNGTNMLIVRTDWSQYWEVELLPVEVFGGYVLNMASPTTWRATMDSAGYIYAYRTSTAGQPVGYNAARQYLTSYSLNIPFDPQFLTQDLVNNLTPMNGVNCLLQCTNPVLL